MVLQEAKAKAALTAIAKGSERGLATFRGILNDAPPGSVLQADMQKLVDLEESELSIIYKALRNDLPSAGQLTKQALIAGGRGAAHLAGRGLSGLGRRLAALEEEPMPGRLPVVSGVTVQQGLNMPGERKRKFPPGDYFLDERLSELRSVDNPNAAIRLNEFELEYFRQRAH